MKEEYRYLGCDPSKEIHTVLVTIKRATLSPAVLLGVAPAFKSAIYRGRPDGPGFINMDTGDCADDKTQDKIEAFLKRRLGQDKDA